METLSSKQDSDDLFCLVVELDEVSSCCGSVELVWGSKIKLSNFMVQLRPSLPIIAPWKMALIASQPLTTESLAY